ncbi:MAG: NUDIX domain-containing protein [Alphaproteobacteria bacterium]|nr:NUDIX domain-containing protein [Alphaproteobacteria bacterium]
MIKDTSYSAYILPVRDGQVALLKYGENGYGPIVGRLNDGEDFLTALRRELTEELGESTSALADSAVEIPVPYAFRHPTPERAQKRGAWGEEHHFFIVHVPDDMELTFCENCPEEISVAWVAPGDLLNPKITPFDDMREFYASHILPNLDCRFSMSLQPEYYEMVRSGEKDIELRLYDEKRRRMRNGDMLLIYNAQNRNDYIRAKIVRLHIAKSFVDLATKISMPRTGFASLNALMSAIEKFYDTEMESKYGIVGIELEVL